MNKTGIPYLDFCWNPCGFGCSKGCPTCWARRQTKGPAAPHCPDCRAFKVHFHPERLEKSASPASRRKPAIVGVQFTGELFDPQQGGTAIEQVLDVCGKEWRHSYVFLTQQYQRARRSLLSWFNNECTVVGRNETVATVRRWHIGTTCTRIEEYVFAEKCFANSAWRWWVSAEPLHTAFRPLGILPEGIIIGQNNQRTDACTWSTIRETASAFRDARVKVYIKQLWLWLCPTCGKRAVENLMGHARCPICGTAESSFRLTLLTNPTLFPADLRDRDLPWTLTTKPPTDFADSAEGKK